ncbi:hypothetical protein MTP99_016070 [Tenebrio molitor]|nr:hypothetical protein MTP99_016070 [Tenebrio molitor]CAH1374749.1 unnamed protein product [Tenebrio molitor]
MMQRRQTIADNQDFRSKNRMDYCMELNRSVSLFLTTTTLLGMSAMMILYAFNDDPINSLLLITPENSHTLYRIPYSFRLIHTVTFSLGIFVTACGIYGYARLNRYALSYYGLSLVLILLWLIYFTIVVFNRDETDLARKKCFRNFKFDQKARYSISILQNMYQCCGSQFYNYEDQVTLPKSCCKDSDNFYCPRENAWPKQCETNRTTLLSALRSSNTMLPLLIFICVGFILTLIEAILVFYMIYRINMQLSDNIMHAIR